MKKLLITSGILIATFATAGVVGYNSIEMEDIKESVIFTAEAKEAEITSIETVETPIVEVVEPAEVIEETEPVGEDPEPDDGCHAEPIGEHQRLAVAELAGDERAAARTPHDPVDVAVDVAVERPRGTGAHRTADEGGHEQPEVGEPVLGEDHGGRGDDEQELHHTRLGEGQVGRERRPGRRRSR